MYKASFIVLTLAVATMAFSAADQAKIESVGQFIYGYAEGVGLLESNPYIEECIGAVSKFVVNGVTFYQAFKTNTISQEEIPTISQTIMTYGEDVKTECSSAFSALMEEYTNLKSKIDNNYGEYMLNYFNTLNQTLQTLQSFNYALQQGDAFSAGAILGGIEQGLYAFNVTELAPQFQAGVEQFPQTAVQAPTLIPGVPKLLQNVTLFLQGFGLGFGIQNTTNQIVQCEVDIDTIGNLTVQIIQDLAHFDLNTILQDIGQIWSNFNDALTDCTGGFNSFYWDFAPVINAAENNVTQLQQTFENNLASHPLQAAILAAQLKIEWSEAQWYSAGTTGAKLGAIGLTGLTNITATA